VTRLHAGGASSVGALRARPPGHARAGGGDPAEEVLRQAAGRASDPAVRQWLTALLRHGESAAGRVGGDRGRPPAKETKETK
jgi:hypothetical protein